MGIWNMKQRFGINKRLIISIFSLALKLLICLNACKEYQNELYRRFYDSGHWFSVINSFVPFQAWSVVLMLVGQLVFLYVSSYSVVANELDWMIFLS